MENNHEKELAEAQKTLNLLQDAFTKVSKHYEERQPYRFYGSDKDMALVTALATTAMALRQAKADLQALNPSPRKISFLAKPTPTLDGR